MDIKFLIPGLALATQLLSVVFAVRLIQYTERRAIGLIFVLVAGLMALRRLISLVRFYSPGDIKVDLQAETIALAVSALILYGIIAITREVASSEKNRHDAASAETRYRTLFNQSPDGVLLMDAQGEIVDFNEAVNQQLGYTREEFSRLRISDIDPVESPADIRERFEKVLRDGKDEFEVRHKTKQGEVRDVLVIIQKVTLSGQTFFHAIWRDITDHKHAEEKILQREQFIRGILDTVDEGFIVIDRDYRILTANQAYVSQVGASPERIVGGHCYAISHRSSRPCYDEGEECAVRAVFETGSPHTALHRHKDAQGNILYVETKAYPIRDASGAVTSVIETLNNITERYLLEEERLKTQKLESIGTLAGGIAHDFNNLLQGVFGYISLAKVVIDQKEKALVMLAQAEEALHLSVNLTAQLLTFSKGGKPAKKITQITPVVMNAVKFALSGSPINYEMDIQDDLWPVEADEGQVAQVIQNIVLNAHEAMAETGTVRVSLANVTIAKDTIVSLPEGGPFVRIDIRDTGMGIPERHLARIFDPYFTTKQKGSGLGLATSYSIMKNHGGAIEVRSELNRGTEFSIYLPASDGPEAQTVAGPTSSAGKKKGLVLLMDDEDLVRNVAREMIVSLGHEAVVAGDGQQAIDLFSKGRAAGNPFDLVILDLTVKGGMGGEEAIRKIRAIDPGVKAIVSSGYSDNPVMADYTAYGFSAALNKPYRIDDLRNCFNQMIG